MGKKEFEQGGPPGCKPKPVEKPMTQTLDELVVKSSTKEEQVRLAVIAWCLSKCHNHEIRIPLKDLAALMNGAAEIVVTGDSERDEYIIRLKRHTLGRIATDQFKQWYKECSHITGLSEEEQEWTDLDDRLNDILEEKDE